MKILAAFLAAILLAPLLAGCQSLPPLPNSTSVSAIQNSGTSPESRGAASEQASPLGAPPVKSDTASSNTAEYASLDYENNIYFELGKTDIDDRGLATLTTHTARLKGNRKLVVTLVGHTDSLGSVAYNQAISDARLAAVNKVLRSQGVARRQIRRISMGNEQKNTVRCRSVNCRQASRRVEFRYEPKAQR